MGENSCIMMFGLRSSASLLLSSCWKTNQLVYTTTTKNNVTLRSLDDAHLALAQESLHSCQSLNVVGKFLVAFCKQNVVQMVEYKNASHLAIGGSHVNGVYLSLLRRRRLPATNIRSRNIYRRTSCHNVPLKILTFHK